MANICENQIYIVGPISEVTTFFENITQWSKSEEYGEFESICIKGGFSKVNNHGKIESTLPCSGTFLIEPDIYQINEEECEIYMETDTKWEPQSEMWLELLKKYAPNSKYYHFSVEPGFGIFQTNDVEGRYFYTTYVVDYYNEDDELIDEIIYDEFEYGLNYFDDNEYHDAILSILQHIVSNKEKINNESFVNACKNILKNDVILNNNDLLTEQFKKVLQDHLSLNDDYDIGFNVHKVQTITYDSYK